MQKKVLQIIQRISADGELLFKEEKALASFDRFPKDKGYLFIARNNKLMHLKSPGFPKEIKAKDLGWLQNVCSEYLSKEGFLMDDNFPINRKKLPEFMQMHRNLVQPFLKRMESLAIMRLVEDYIFVNPIYLTVNTYLPAELYKVFQEELDPHLPDWVIKKYKQLSD